LNVCSEQDFHDAVSAMKTEHRMSVSSSNGTVRLIKLLNSMSERSFRHPPRNVGLKTVITAEKAGLVQREGSLGLRPRCKLTREGKDYLRNHGFPTQLTADAAAI
jgi:hypothetical protein